MLPVDIAVTNVKDDITADIFYDGKGFPCQYDWGVSGRTVRVDQRTGYKDRRHLVLALLVQGAIKVEWIDNLSGKEYIFKIDDIDQLLVGN